MLNMRFDTNWGLRLQQAYTGTGNIQYNFIHRYNNIDYNSLTFKGANVGIGTTNARYKLHFKSVKNDVFSGFHLDATDDNTIDKYTLTIFPYVVGPSGHVGWRFRTISNVASHFPLSFDNAGKIEVGNQDSGVIVIGNTTLGSFVSEAKLKVYGADANQCSAIFKHPNDTQGIGIVYDGLLALGNTANQSIIMRPRGTGSFSVEYGGVSKFSVNSAGGLTIGADTNAITSGGGGRTYYINNGPSLYWGYGTGDTHQFRNSANTNLFTISNEGVLAMKENVWHKDIGGYNRIYFESGSTTYISGHGNGGVYFRQNTNTTTALITNIGQWACHFRTIANSNTDDIGVNSNTTLDDGYGCNDLSFFEDSQQSYAHVIKGSNLIIAKGFIRRTGARGVSIRATAAWALDELYQNWISGKINEVDQLPIDQKLAKR